MKVQDQYLYTRPVGEGVEGPPVKKVLPVAGRC